jgi:hypothetical protein
MHPPESALLNPNHNPKTTILDNCESKRYHTTVESDGTRIMVRFVWR